MAQRIQRSRAKAWRMPEGAVYVGRPSKWGNPFRVYHGHSLIGPSWSLARAAWHHIPADECTAGYVTSSHMTPGEPVRAYRDLLKVRARDETERLSEWLAPLVGHDLACWCALDQPCHADVLLEFVALRGLEDAGPSRDSHQPTESGTRQGATA